MSTAQDSKDTNDKKSYAGIPEAEFVVCNLNLTICIVKKCIFFNCLKEVTHSYILQEDVDAFIAKPENNHNVDKVLKKFDEQHSKYKFMEYNLITKRKKLRSQIPDLKRSLSMIEKLENQKDEFETEYLLSEQVFVKAIVPPTDKVCLWLGANVMLEYTLVDAKKLLKENIEIATKNLGFIEHDLDFLR